MAETEMILIKNIMTVDGLGVYDYESLANLPEIDDKLTEGSTNAIQNAAVATAINNISTEIQNTNTKIENIVGTIDGEAVKAADSNKLGGQPPEYYAPLNTNGISIYTHSKTGTVHNFVGAGNNGKAKMTANVEAGDTFAINGTEIPAYMGIKEATVSMAGCEYTDRWVTFIYDGSQINFTNGSGNKTLSTYMAALPSSDWSVTEDGGYTQTVSCTSIDGGVAMNSEIQLGGPMARPTGVQSIDKAQQKVLNIINMGVTTPGDNTVTIKVWKQPTTDINVYWYGK